MAMATATTNPRTPPTLTDSRCESQRRTTTDDDGYADNWTDYYNGTNAQGIFIDACPTEWGNSTRRI